jgi:hypothetical protein
MRRFGRCCWIDPAAAEESVARGRRGVAAFEAEQTTGGEGLAGRHKVSTVWCLGRQDAPPDPHRAWQLRSQKDLRPTIDAANVDVEIGRAQEPPSVENVRTVGRSRTTTLRDSHSRIHRSAQTLKLSSALQPYPFDLRPNHHVAHVLTPANGNRTMNTVRPGRDSTLMSPPCRRTML